MSSFIIFHYNILLLLFFSIFYYLFFIFFFFFFSSRRRHTRFDCDWSSDVCSSDLALGAAPEAARERDGPALARAEKLCGHRASGAGPLLPLRHEQVAGDAHRLVRDRKSVV